MPARAHTAGRGWTPDQLGAAEDRLATRGLLDASGLTERGREEREQIDAATDAAMTPALKVLGNDIDQILATLEPWGGSGPHRRRLPHPAGAVHVLRTLTTPAEALVLGYLDVTRRHVMYVVTSIPSICVVGVLKTANSPSKATWRSTSVPTSFGSAAPRGVRTNVRRSSATT